MYLMKRSALGSCLSAIALSSAAVGVLSLTSCGGDRPKEAPPIAAATNSVPDWVKDPTMGDKIFGAYGVADQNLAGESAQRKQGMITARGELAAMICSQIQSVTKDWVRVAGTVTKDENNQMAMKSFEDATRNLVNQALSGSGQRDRHIDEKSGKMYLWVTVNAEIAKKIAEDAKKAAREAKDIRAHFASAIEAEKAFDKLDALIDKKMAGGVDPNAK